MRQERKNPGKSGSYVEHFWKYILEDKHFHVSAFYKSQEK